MPDKVENKRELRIASRRGQILDAAARLFAERGFHLATTSDIAHAAGVSEGTLYNYFKNKDDLLMGLLEILINQQLLQSSLIAALPQDPQEYLVSVLRARREFTNENMLYLQSIISEIFVNPDLRRRYLEEFYLPSADLLADHLESRVALGQLGTIDAAVSSRLVLGMLFGIFLMQVLKDPVVEERWNDLESGIVRALLGAPTGGG